MMLISFYTPANKPFIQKIGNKCFINPFVNDSIINPNKIFNDKTIFFSSSFSFLSKIWSRPIFFECLTTCFSSFNMKLSGSLFHSFFSSIRSIFNHLLSFSCPRFFEIISTGNTAMLFVCNISKILNTIICFYTIYMMYLKSRFIPHILCMTKYFMYLKISGSIFSGRQRNTQIILFQKLNNSFSGCFINYMPLFKITIIPLYLSIFIIYHFSSPLLNSLYNNMAMFNCIYGKGE